jgi:hypothetical protein
MNNLSSDSNWKPIYKAGGISLFIFILYAIATMIIMPTIGAQPDTVHECFDLLENNRIIGLIRLDILTVIFLPLYFIIYFAIYGIIKNTNKPLSQFWTILLFAGVILFLATPSAYSLIPLSDRYFSTQDIEIRNQLVAAAEALRASDMWHMTGSVMGSILTQIAGIGISILMIKTPYLGKKIGLLGIITHGLDLTHFFAYVFGFDLISTILIAIAGILYFPLYGILGFRLIKLGGARYEKANSL